MSQSREIMPTCKVCGRRKAPLGRDVPAIKASDFCHWSDCDGYDEDPLPSHLWRGEDQDRDESNDPTGEMTGQYARQGNEPGVGQHSGNPPGGKDRCPVTGEVDCTRCSGEYCDFHFDKPCDCDVLSRHGIGEEDCEPLEMPQ